MVLKIVCRHLGFIIFALSVFVCVLVASARANGAGWFEDATPTVIQGKTGVGYQARYPVDCNDELLFNGSLISPAFTTACAVDTSIGAVTPDGKIIVDDQDTYRLTDKTGNRNTFILPVPNGNGYIRTYFAPSWGGYISKYSALTRSDLLKKTYSGVPDRIQYEVQAEPDIQLTDSEGTRIQSSGPPLVFSSNGQWMIVDVPYVGLFRVNADLTEMVPFAKSIEQIAPGAPYYIAISNDGNYVALSTTNNLTLYGLVGCSQHNFTYGSPVSTMGCVSREIWNDHNGIAGIRDQVSGSGLAERLQFVDNDTLKFVARHRNGSNTENIYNEYYVSAPGTTLRKLAFLGMGDSYISGEGIGMYRAGTDTSDNKCHLSPQSYPYLVGEQLFDSFESVACSGAKMIDVNDDHLSYTGQTKNKIALSDREPNKEEILASFSPGYAQQRWFVKEYHPKTAIISIGGNDVHFASMVKSCVVPEPANATCYSTYQERKQKAREIYHSFGKLVTTYEDILNNGTENLYVVGYPEVAEEDGSCGVNVHLNNDEIIFSNRVVHYLNQVIEAAADKAGARYVNVEQALDGHRLCEASGGSIAMNGLTVGNDNFFLGNESYHPNALGHRLLMKTILEQTNNMQEPMPAKNNNAQPPQVTDDMPLLAGMTPAPELPRLESVDDITTGTLVRNAPISLYVDGLGANTAPNTKYRVELHSNPTILGILTSDANGNISGKLTIPADIAPGIHTLNLYGPSYGGEQIQIQQFVYVAATEDDADGNGVPNMQQPCIVVEASGLDTDEDGIDDACDPIIGESPVVTDTPQTEGAAASVSDQQAKENINGSTNSIRSVSDQQSPEKNKNEVLGDKTTAKGKSTQAFSDDSSATNFWLESLAIAGILAFGLSLLIRSKSTGDL